MKKWLPKMIILLLLLALSFYAFTKVRIETEAQTYACIASDVNVQKKYQTIFLVNSDGFNKGLGPQIVDVDEEMQNKGYHRYMTLDIKPECEPGNKTITKTISIASELILAITASFVFVGAWVLVDGKKS